MFNSLRTSVSLVRRPQRVPLPRSPSLRILLSTSVQTPRRNAWIPVAAGALTLSVAFAFGTVVRLDSTEDEKRMPRSKAKQKQSSQVEQFASDGDKPTAFLQAKEEDASAEADSDGDEGGESADHGGGGGAFNPETGEINWDCPCLGGMAHGPCGQEFRDAFSCFLYSEEEPRSSQAQALTKVHTPGSAPLSDTQSTSYFCLATPIEAESALACMRYDLTVYLPPILCTLRVISSSVTQVKVDFDDTPRELHLLSLDLKSQASTNPLLPSAGLIADNVDINMRGGYIVGTLPIANSTRVDTRAGDAITKLGLFTSGYAFPETDEEISDNAAIAHLTTLTGTGRSDFSYDNRAVRPIRSEHSSRGLGDSELRLTYGEARFNGKIEVEARSYSMRNVQSDGFGSRPGNYSREWWVGDKDGGDFLEVRTPGWLGLF